VLVVRGRHPFLALCSSVLGPRGVRTTPSAEGRRGSGGQPPWRAGRSTSEALLRKLRAHSTAQRAQEKARVPIPGSQREDKGTQHSKPQGEEEGRGRGIPQGDNKVAVDRGGGGACLLEVEPVDASSSNSA